MSETTQSEVGGGASLKGESAKAVYSRLESLRWITLERARDCSALTLPALLPSQWVNDQTPIPTPYQSVGARGVNNLASKLLLAMFPPGQPFFRLKVRNDVAGALGENLSKIETALASVEETVNDQIEQSHARPLMSETMKHLIVSGNALLNVPSTEGMRFFRLDQYCIVRDAEDRPLRVVIKETTVAGSIKPDVAAVCQVDKADEVSRVDIYTMIEWDYINNRVRSWQEINDKRVPDSDSWQPLEKSEWLPLRWVAVPGRDYGRGMVEEYLGDLRSLEGISEAIVQYADAAAKIVLLVHPNSTTNPTEINNAESGDAIVGSKADIDTLQLDKQQDFAVVENVAQRLEERLSYAFLIQTGVTRDAERVTAEEIRAVAQELEDALGGVYTVLARELQLPFVNRLMALMTQERKIPSLPKEALNPVVITGFEALGRNHQLNKLRAMAQDLSAIFGAQVVGGRLKFSEFARRFALGYGVESPNDLWLDDQAFAEQQKAQAAQEAMVKAAPQAAGPLLKHALGQDQQ